MDSKQEQHTPSGGVSERCTVYGEPLSWTKDRNDGSYNIPTSLRALVDIELMWVDHDRVLVMMTPRYLYSVTCSSGLL